MHKCRCIDSEFTSKTTMLEEYISTFAFIVSLWFFLSLAYACLAHSIYSFLVCCLSWLCYGLRLLWHVFDHYWIRDVYSCRIYLARHWRWWSSLFYHKCTPFGITIHSTRSTKLWKIHGFSSKRKSIHFDVNIQFKIISWQQPFACSSFRKPYYWSKLIR